MAVKLRLRRMGRKKRPFYRIVAADARAPRDGRFIEEIGYYNPIADPAVIEVKEERALYWLQQGAIPTDTVKSLLRKKGIILKFDLLKKGLPPEKIEEELTKREEAKRAQAAKAAAKKEEKVEAPQEAEPAETPAEEETPEKNETQGTEASSEENTKEEQN